MPLPREVWIAKFPFDDDPVQSKNRPIIIYAVDNTNFIVVGIKVTSHACRLSDSFDIDLLDWKAANLQRPSVARVSKLTDLSAHNCLKKIGVLSERDWNAVSQTVSRFYQSQCKENTPTIPHKRKITMQKNSTREDRGNSR